MNPQLKTQYKAAERSGGPGHQFQQKSSTAQRIGVHSSSTAQRIGAHSSNLLPETYDDAAVFGLRTNGAGIRQALYNASFFLPSIVIQKCESMLCAKLPKGIPLSSGPTWIHAVSRSLK